MMSTQTLQKIFLASIPYYQHIRFIWHGGEPTSAGVDFYRQALRMQREINDCGTVIENSIQTNLTLADEEMFRFFVENKFHIGSSFDGTTNDMTRHNTDRILAGREKVLSCGGTVGFICVVQSHNADRLIEDYEWFKSKGINYTLNPYLTSPPFEDDALFVDVEHYIKAFCDLFDYWKNDKECQIRLSSFYEYLHYILFKEKSLCCYKSCLGKHIGVLYDGRIFNCNRDFPEEFCYGNISDYRDIRECFESEGFKRSIDAAYTRRQFCMQNCGIYDFCEGGCNSCAMTYGDMSQPNPYLCQITKAIYEHIKNSVLALAAQDVAEGQINPQLYQMIRRYRQTADKA